MLNVRKFWFQKLIQNPVDLMISASGLGMSLIGDVFSFLVPTSCMMLCLYINFVANAQFSLHPESINNGYPRLLFHLGNLSYQMYLYVILPLYLYGTNSKMRWTVFDHFGVYWACQRIFLNIRQRY